MNERPPAGFELAGAVVRRPITSGGQRLPIGHVMPPEAFAAIGNQHRRVLVRDDMLTPFYVRSDAEAAATRNAARRGK